MNSTAANIEYKFLAVVKYDDGIGEKQARDMIFSGDPEYLKEDEKRLQEWRDDKFFFCHVRVVVEQHNWSTGNTVTYQSACVGGIESDINEQHLLQLAYEQVGELQTEFPNMPKFNQSDLKLIWK